MNKCIEIWNIISEFPNYEISSFGRVRSKNCILKQKKNPKGGHLYVALYNNKGKFYKRVHILVAKQFLPKSEYKLVLHNDGNAENNKVENLRWGNQSQNILDSVLHQTHNTMRGEDHPMRKLNNEIVLKMREMASLGFSIKQISITFGYHYITTYDAVTRKSWKHI